MVKTSEYPKPKAEDGYSVVYHKILRYSTMHHNIRRYTMVYSNYTKTYYTVLRYAIRYYTKTYDSIQQDAIIYHRMLKYAKILQHIITDYSGFDFTTLLYYTVLHCNTIP